jgi:hypothetical protein
MIQCSSIDFSPGTIRTRETRSEDVRRQFHARNSQDAEATAEKKRASTNLQSRLIELRDG